MTTTTSRRRGPFHQRGSDACDLCVYRGVDPARGRQPYAAPHFARLMLCGHSAVEQIHRRNPRWARPVRSRSGRQRAGATS